MKSLLTYLNEPIESWDGRGPFGFLSPPEWLPVRPTRLCVFAALVAMNGGLVVRSWGVTQGGGPYGKQGLEQSEALALIEMGAYIAGWLEATSDADRDQFFAAVNAEHARVIALHDGKPPP